MPQQALTGSRKQLTRLVTSKMPRQPAEEDSQALQEIIAGHRGAVVGVVFHRNSGPPPSNVKPFIHKYFPAVVWSLLSAKDCAIDYVSL